MADTDLDAAAPRALAPGLDAEDLDGDDGPVADGVVQARLVAPDAGLDVVAAAPVQAEEDDAVVVLGEGQAPPGRTRHFETLHVLLLRAGQHDPEVLVLLVHAERPPGGGSSSLAGQGGWPFRKFTNYNVGQRSLGNKTQNMR